MINKINTRSICSFFEVYIDQDIDDQVNIKTFENISEKVKTSIEDTNLHILINIKLQLYNETAFTLFHHINHLEDITTI